MRTIRCYLAEENLTANAQYPLSKETSHHVTNVLRLREGDEVEVFDGKGNSFNAKIIQTGKQVIIQTLSAFKNQISESLLSMHLFIAVGKGDKMDWIMQKATELGATEITPVLSQRVEVRLDASRWQKKIDHWQEIIINACEQCGRNMLPALHSIRPIKEVLQQPLEGLKLILHPHVTNTVSLVKPSAVNILIGPEGGFTEAEVAAALTHGFQPVLLGPRVLRMETAAISALAVLQAQWGDMQLY